MRYRKKPVVIEAIQFIEKDYLNDNDKYIDFCLCFQDAAHLSELWMDKTAEDGRYLIRTLEGDMRVSEGDYIIKGVNGEYYPCKPDIFDKTYEIVR